YRDLVARNAVVLLGESHTDVDHHRVQLQSLAALYGRGGNIVIGFEAFPRRLQSVLGDWVEGKLTDEAFLKASEWRQVWGYDAALYMPLFQFARLNRVPMIALNVERKLVSQVGQQGWEGVPAAEREGLSDPAPATAACQRELARVYAMKKTLPPGVDPASIPAGTHMPEPDEAALADAIKQPEFKRFVAAQLTWDRAMAEALAGAKRKFSNATIVGILGSGHVEEGYGVPHQLKHLGVTAPPSGARNLAALEHQARRTGDRHGRQVSGASAAESMMQLLAPRSRRIDLAAAVVASLAGTLTAAAQAPPPHHDIVLTLDPAVGAIKVRDRIQISGHNDIALRLTTWMRTTDIRLDGQPASARFADGRLTLTLPSAGPHQIHITAEGTIA